MQADAQSAGWQRRKKQEFGKKMQHEGKYEALEASSELRSGVHGVDREHHAPHEQVEVGNGKDGGVAGDGRSTR